MAVGCPAEGASLLTPRVRLDGLLASTSAIMMVLVVVTVVVVSLHLMAHLLAAVPFSSPAASHMITV